MCILSLVWLTVLTLLTGKAAIVQLTGLDVHLLLDILGVQAKGVEANLSWGVG